MYDVYIRRPRAAASLKRAARARRDLDAVAYPPPSGGGLIEAGQHAPKIVTDP